MSEPSSTLAGSSAATVEVGAARDVALSRQIELEHHIVDLKFFRQARGTVVVFRGVKETLEHVDRDWTSKGDQFLMACGFNLVRVVPKWRTYYRTDDVLAFLPQLASSKVFSAYPGVATYGTSMGGYGALAYARVLGATKAVALAPFSTLSTAILPWEDRFPKSSARLDWTGPLHDATTEVAAPAETLICYDPLETKDRAHTLRLAQARAVAGCETVLCRAPGAGHNVFKMMALLGLLKPLVHDFLLGAFSPSTFNAAMRARRGLEFYYDTLSEHRRVAQSPAFNRIVAEHKAARLSDGSLCREAVPRSVAEPAPSDAKKVPWALLHGAGASA